MWSLCSSSLDLMGLHHLTPLSGRSITAHYSILLHMATEKVMCMFKCPHCPPENQAIPSAQMKRTDLQSLSHAVWTQGLRREMLIFAHLNLVNKPSFIWWQSLKLKWKKKIVTCWKWPCACEIAPRYHKDKSHSLIFKPWESCRVSTWAGFLLFFHSPLGPCGTNVET